MVKTEDRIIEEKKEKLAELRERGINPYPHIYHPTASCREIIEEFDHLESEERTANEERVAGRIMSIRDMGSVAFVDLKDEYETIQLFFHQDSFDRYDLLDLLDRGDFVGAEGEVFKTKTGELSIDVDDLKVLSKSIRPLPDDFYGVQDRELKYRKRFLDLAVNDESRQLFRKRSEIVSTLRDYMNERGYMEVETPELHPIYGGANAKPFETYFDALDQNYYLRVAPELYLKRLIVGGYKKVFEIGKNFRNEDIDTTHNPEFTMLEAYEAYADYKDMMQLFENAYEYVAKEVFGTLTFEYEGETIDFSTPWNRVSVAEKIEDDVGIKVNEMSEEQLENYIDREEIEFDDEPNWGNYVMAIFEEKCEECIIQPTFVIDHPRESTPLAKQHREEEGLVERFEPFCAGQEIGNSFSELNDPIEQRRLLEDQARQLDEGFEEANPFDENFVQAIEQGMPPTGGVGIGIDRMVMLFTDQQSIRDVILFPALKKKE